jgi:hypothetical protein
MVVLLFVMTAGRRFYLLTVRDERRGSDHQQVALQRPES